jgi:Rieske Fe-S protein
VKLAVVSGAAAFGATACASSTGPEAFGDVAAGNVEDLALGTVVAIKGAPACIGRDERGIYAMTLTCTHEGCDMGTDGSVGPTTIVCDCHGSIFDANGKVVRGPARDVLQHFSVTADATGALTVHGGVMVDSAARLAI